MNGRKSAVLVISRRDLEAHHRMPDGKLIATVQMCGGCGKMFAFKRERRRCPRCQGSLRVKTIVLERGSLKRRKQWLPEILEIE